MLNKKFICIHTWSDGLYLCDFVRKNLDIKGIGVKISPVMPSTTLKSNESNLTLTTLKPGNTSFVHRH